MLVRSHPQSQLRTKTRRVHCENKTRQQHSCASRHLFFLRLTISFHYLDHHFHHHFSPPPSHAYMAATLRRARPRALPPPHHQLPSPQQAAFSLHLFLIISTPHAAALALSSRAPPPCCRHLQLRPQLGLPPIVSCTSCRALPSSSYRSAFCSIFLIFFFLLCFDFVKI